MLKYVGMCPKCCFPPRCYSSDNNARSRKLCRSFAGWAEAGRECRRAGSDCLWLRFSPKLMRKNDETCISELFRKYIYLFPMRKLVPRKEMCNVGCRERYNSKNAWHGFLQHSPTKVTATSQALQFEAI